jgi:hypothetical protein
MLFVRSNKTHANLPFLNKNSFCPISKFQSNFWQQSCFLQRASLEKGKH